VVRSATNRMMKGMAEGSPLKVTDDPTNLVVREAATPRTRPPPYANGRLENAPRAAAPNA
jgi:hypothetical protein